MRVCQVRCFYSTEDQKKEEESNEQTDNEENHSVKEKAEEEVKSAEVVTDQFKEGLESSWICYL